MNDTDPREERQRAGDDRDLDDRLGAAGLTRARFERSSVASRVRAGVRVGGRSGRQGQLLSGGEGGGVGGGLRVSLGDEHLRNAGHPHAAEQTHADHRGRDDRDRATLAVHPNSCLSVVVACI
jgi:hypothetical protein